MSQPARPESAILQELRAVTERIGVLSGEQVKAIKAGEFGKAETISAQMRELVERQRELCRDLLA